MNSPSNAAVYLIWIARPHSVQAARPLRPIACAARSAVRGGQAQGQQRRQRDRKIVEDRGLPALPADHRHGQQVEDARAPGTDRGRAQATGDVQDHRRGRTREQGCRHLIDDDAIRRDQPEPREQQEEAVRLAVPKVDERHRAVQHPVADQQIPLLVDIKHRIAEIPAAQQQRQHQHRRQYDGWPLPRRQ
jgi:hypothetical protein